MNAAPVDDDDSPSSSTTIVAPLGKSLTHTIIFLHGREDFGSDLAQYIFESKASDGASLAEIFPSVKWVFPTAKFRYSAQRDFEFRTSSFAESLKGEEIISQWFDVWDIKSPNDKQKLMIPGLKESIQDIVNIIREEAEIVTLEHIILGGISQGCATAIYTFLFSGIDLGGFIGLSSWLPFQTSLETIRWTSDKSKDKISGHIQTILQMSQEPVPKATDTEATPKEKFDNLSMCRQSVRTPVFLAHSQDDDTVPFAHGQSLHHNIENLGFDVTWKEYEDGGHWIHSQYGMDDISAFLRKIIEVQLVNVAETAGVDAERKK